jgi:hypothetical protein
MDQSNAVVEVIVENDWKKKKKKKKGSSRAARRLDDVESRVTKSVHRVSRGVNQGVVTYIKKRNRSARKRRDGAILDLGTNVVKGVARAVRKSSKAPIPLATIVNSRRLRKRIRKVLKNVPKVF